MKVAIPTELDVDNKWPVKTLTIQIQGVKLDADGFLVDEFEDRIVNFLFEKMKSLPHMLIQKIKKIVIRQEN